jgi:hypothetical protein
MRDNKYFSGMPDKMLDWLTRKHGAEEMQKLLVRKNIAQKLSGFDMNILKDLYKTAFNELVKIKGNPWM